MMRAKNNKSFDVVWVISENVKLVVFTCSPEEKPSWSPSDSNKSFITPIARHFYLKTITRSITNSTWITWNEWITTLEWRLTDGDLSFKAKNFACVLVRDSGNTENRFSQHFDAHFGIHYRPVKRVFLKQPIAFGFFFLSHHPREFFSLFREFLLCLHGNSSMCGCWIFFDSFSSKRELPHESVSVVVVVPKPAAPSTILQMIVTC